MKTFPFEVTEVPGGAGVKNITVTVKVEKAEDQAPALNYLRSIQLKNDFMDNWARQHAPGYGLEIRGGPSPVFNDPQDRSSGVIGYTQSFRMSRSV